MSQNGKEITDLRLIAYQAEEVANWGLRTRILKLLEFFETALTLQQVFLALRANDDWSKKAIAGVIGMMAERDMVTVDNQNDEKLFTLPQTS